MDGTRVEATETLEVMGLVLRVGMSIYELASPLATRARAKFRELKHIFRAKGGSMKQRAKVMQRVVGGTALWCICCLPPDATTMTMLNSVQLQLMVWLLRFARRSGEGWEEFRQRAFRGARAAPHRFKVYSLNKGYCAFWDLHQSVSECHDSIYACSFTAIGLTRRSVRIMDCLNAAHVPNPKIH